VRLKLYKIKKPFIIAELSANHNGNIKNIFKLIDEAKNCGAHAVKIQSYTADSMTLNCKNKHFYIRDGLWKGNFLYDLYKKGTTPFGWHKKIFSYAKKKKLLCFSTPFDLKSVHLLEKLKTPIYKIASFEINHIPLLEAIGKTKKPVIVSTGMASHADIKLALKILKKNGTKDIVLLHCISSYPALPENYNLNFINALTRKHKSPVGLSDHTKGNLVAICSVALGVRIFEKHIKLNTEKGLDAKFSTNCKEFKNYVLDINRSFASLGSKNFNRNKVEGLSKKHRRSIFICKDVKKDDLITNDNISIIRPSNGLHPKYLKEVLRKKFKNNFQMGKPLRIQDVCS